MYRVLAVAEIDTEKGGSVDVRSPGATPSCVAEVHDDETGIGEGAMLGSRSNAYSGSPVPNSVVADDHNSVGNYLLRAHGTLDQVLGVQLGVVVPLERLRILHRECQRLDQALIESSGHQGLDLLRASSEGGGIPRQVLDELSFGLAARSDPRRPVSGSSEGHLKAHTKRLP